MAGDGARAAVIDGLRRALQAHREGRVIDIHGSWDEVAALECDDPRVSIALNLWESWADTAVHGWQYHAPFTADDWPRMASSVIEALERDQSIVDEVILAHFVPKPPEPSWLSRLLDRLRSLGNMV